MEFKFSELIKFWTPRAFSYTLFCGLLFTQTAMAFCHCAEMKVDGYARTTIDTDGHTVLFFLKIVNDQGELALTAGRTSWYDCNQMANTENSRNPVCISQK